MNMIMIMIKNKIFALMSLILVASCSLSPGMHMSPKNVGGQEYIYVSSIDEDLLIENISSNEIESLNLKKAEYRISAGDQIAITVWGLPDIFPITNISPDQNLRRVDSNGEIFFPFAGSIRAQGKTQNELRTSLTEKLAENFNDPQLDVSIARFNSQKVYLLGEVSKPLKIFITDIKLSLADAIGEVSGFNTNSSDPAEVYIIRQGIEVDSARIFKADLSSPSAFIDASNFYLQDGDIVYVNAKGTTRWNRVVSQFFPFSTFLNSVDALTSSD